MALVSLPLHKLATHHVVIIACNELKGIAFGLALVA
jgi:hypothetical protein